MDIFVYGTLRDRGVREAVLGHPVAMTIAARKPDYAQRLVKGRSFPMLKPRAGSVAEGLILCDLSEDDIAALDAFEGETYRRRASSVVDDDGKQRQVYIYEETAGYEDGGAFDLDDWAHRLRDDFISGFMKKRGFNAPKT